jgi:type I restriction enzyme S subunit
MMSKSNYKRLGDYIREVDVRNDNLRVSMLLGLTINKQFIPSVANTIGADMENKIIRKNQFACSTMQVRRDGKMPVALLKDVEEAIISQAYLVFEVVNEEVLLPDYLMLWFRRSEFDRYARFHSWGSARETFDWVDICDVKLPIPDIEVQKAIVTIYHTLEIRKRINGKLKDMLKTTMSGVDKGSGGRYDNNIK